MKIPAEFAPKSWETPPGARVIEASASIVARDFDGETLNWLVALVEIPTLEHPITWVRPLNSRFDSGFVVLANYSSIPFVVTRQYPLEAPLTLLTVMLQQNRLGRLLFINEEGNLCEQGELPLELVIVSPVGVAAWSAVAVADNSKDVTPFKWGESITNDEFIRLTARDIWELGQSLLEDSRGYVSFTRKFAFLDEEARHELIFDSTPITHETFETLLRDLILSQDFWSNSEIEVGTSTHNRGKPIIQIHLNTQQLEVNTQLDKEKDLLWRLFQPVREDIAYHECVIKWLQTRSKPTALYISRPTAHEQLEAKLRWREWKAKHEKI